MNIQTVWRAFYDQKVPLGHRLRQQFASRWLRTHSLPESRRYARDEAEMHEILRRYNSVATTVLGEGASCAVFFPDYALQHSVSWRGELFCRVKNDVPEVTLLAAVTRWKSGEFDAILREVADDEVQYVLWMNIQSGEIFAPYDGGADLILNSTPRRDELRARWRDWLSRHPEGF